VLFETAKKGPLQKGFRALALRFASDAELPACLCRVERRAEQV